MGMSDILEWNHHCDKMLAVAQYALEHGVVTEGQAAHGICLRIIDKGYGELSEGQKRVIEEYVLPKCIVTCPRCQEETHPYDLGFGGIYCAYCEDKMSKDD